MNKNLKMQVQLAYAIAQLAHAGQKYDEHDYFKFHVLRVTQKVKGNEAKAVALLHDVLEDTDIDLETLERLFNPDIVAAVLLLTRGLDEPYDSYIQKILDMSGNVGDLARTVKRADAQFNYDYGGRDRYRKVLEALDARISS